MRTEHLAIWENYKQDKQEKHAKHESEGCGPSLWHFGEMIKQEELQTRETNGETG